MRDRKLECGDASVRILAGGAEFSISVGKVSTVLDRRNAQDVVSALTYALLATVPHHPAAGGARKPRMRTARPTKRDLH
jgi:hypothetical protein